jgi:hypothetical protein
MRIAVQLSDTAARSLRAPATARETPRDDPLANLARELHVSLEPTHPDSPDPTLRTWYSVDVPDEATAHSVATQLLRRPEVVAAYVKPPDALP